MFSKKLLLFVGLLIMWMLFAASVTTAQIYLRVNKLDVSDFPNGKAIISVLSRSGMDIEPVPDLHSVDFAIYEDLPSTKNRNRIKNLAVQLFEDSDEGVSVVVAVDASGSIKDKSLVDAKKAINRFSSELRPQDYVAVLSFHDNVKVALFEPSTGEGKSRFTRFKDDEPMPVEIPPSTQFLFTNDREELAKAINSIQVGGRITVLYQAIIRAVQIAANGSNLYRGVVVLSDGHNEDTAYDDVDICIQAAQKYEIPVFTIGVGWEKASWLQFMKRIGDETGATYRHVTKSDQLDRAYHLLKELLLKQYILSFTFDKIKKDGREHELLISVMSGGQQTAQQVAFKAPLGLPVVVGGTEGEPSAGASSLAKVQAALAEHPQLAGRVDAQESGEQIILSGKVPNSQLKQTALALAQAAAPGKSISDSGISVKGDRIRTGRIILFSLVGLVIVAVIVVIFVVYPVQIGNFFRRKTSEEPSVVEELEATQETTPNESEEEETEEEDEADTEEEEPEEEAVPPQWGTLTVKGGSFDSQTFGLAGNQVSVGSDSENDIVLEDEALGNFQVALNRRQGGVQLVDISDEPVVSVNGESAPIDLNNGDTIKIGSVELVFNLSASTDTPPTKTL